MTLLIQLNINISIIFIFYSIFLTYRSNRSVFEFSRVGNIFCYWTTKRKRNSKFVRLKSSNMNSRINGSETWWPVRGGTILGWTRVSPDTLSISPPKWYKPIKYNSNGFSIFPLNPPVWFLIMIGKSQLADGSTVRGWSTPKSVELWPNTQTSHNCIGIISRRYRKRFWFYNVQQSGIGSEDVKSFDRRKHFPGVSLQVFKG